MPLYAGIDVGSMSSEAVILDEAAEMKAAVIIDTGANSTSAAEAALRAALTQAGKGREDLARIVATGYGRVSVPFADKAVTEISCHAAGAYHLFPRPGPSSTSAARTPR